MNFLDAGIAPKASYIRWPLEIHHRKVGEIFSCVPFVAGNNASVFFVCMTVDEMVFP